MAKERAQNKPLEELPLIDWKDAANMAGEEDDAFVVDLLAGFYEEEYGVIDEILQIFQAYRDGTDTDVEKMGEKIQNLAHRVKGGAANVRLMRLARSAYLLEQKFKSPVEDKKTEEIDTLLKKPPQELQTFAEQMDTFIDYLKNTVKPYAEGNLGEDVEQETLDLLSNINVQNCHSKVQGLRQ